jgi:hypothetical protein
MSGAPSYHEPADKAVMRQVLDPAYFFH